MKARIGGMGGGEGKGRHLLVPVTTCPEKSGKHEKKSEKKRRKRVFGMRV